MAVQYPRTRIWTLTLTTFLLLLGIAPAQVMAQAAEPGPASIAGDAAGQLPSSSSRSMGSNVAAHVKPIRKCVDKARKQARKNKKYKYWTCIGNSVRYAKKKKLVRPQHASLRTNDQQSHRSAHRLPPDPQDWWCESSPKCTTIRTLWYAEMKANAAYGWDSEIWGAFDVIWTQSFSGARNRYRVRLIWDAGYQVDSFVWIAQVRRGIPLLPDPVTGRVELYPSYISGSRFSAASTSTKTLRAVDSPTNFTGSHHDDLYGSFVANSQMFGSSTLHLPNFHCPQHSCKYYGPTGPT